VVPIGCPNVPGNPIERRMVGNVLRQLGLPRALLELLDDVHWREQGRSKDVHFALAPGSTSWVKLKSYKGERGTAL